MKWFLLFCIFFVPASVFGQISVSVDTSRPGIKQAAQFLTTYLIEFKNNTLPDLKNYWCAQDCKRSKLPDDMAYSISTDRATYNFGTQQSVFYAQEYKGYVHLKTLFSSTDSIGSITVWAITNHYVQLGSKPSFVSELELHKQLYATTKAGSIVYHYPKTHVFSRSKSNALVTKQRRIEKEWGFKPVPVDYYFADSREALVHMQGMDYCWGMDGTEPSGISFPEAKSIFCQGMGEGYLHEILHLYFNPLYQSSPVCHGLVYYLGGGIGHDFDWMIQRMNAYLQTNPDLDLTDYEHLYAKDKMLHIDHVVNGLLCKIIYEKQGVTGLKRILAYKTTDELFEKEFHIAAKDKTAFLRTQFAAYSKTRSCKS